MIRPQLRALPGDRTYSRGLARSRAIRSYRLTNSLSDWHIARRAAAGRLSFFEGKVPQRGSATIEAIAWERESGRIPGYHNRRWRKYEKSLTVRDQGTTLAA